MNARHVLGRPGLDKHAGLNFPKAPSLLNFLNPIFESDRHLDPDFQGIVYTTIKGMIADWVDIPIQALM